MSSPDAPAQKSEIDVEAPANGASLAAELGALVETKETTAVQTGEGLDVTAARSALDQALQAPAQPAMPENQTSIEALSAQEPLADQLLHLYETQFHAPTVHDQSDLPEITLNEIPALKAAFDHLEVPEPLANEMYAAWSAYEGLNQIAKKGKKPLTKLSADESRQGAEMQTAVMLRQLRGITEFVEKHGLAELIEVNRIFHTLNFSHYEPDQLHEQLERWNDPRKRRNRVEKVAVLGTADSTEATRYAGKTVRMAIGTKLNYLLGRPKPVLFEAGSKKQVAEIAMEVGDHERSAGREPDVSDFIIMNHGNSEGDVAFVRLGPDESLSTRDYTEAEAGREKLGDQARINDYTRSLGPHYRNVLVVCKGAAAPPKGGKSLGEAMRDGHNATVLASPVDITSTRFFHWKPNRSTRPAPTRASAHAPDVAARTRVTLSGNGPTPISVAAFELYADGSAQFMTEAGHTPATVFERRPDDRN